MRLTVSGLKIFTLISLLVITGGCIQNNGNAPSSDPGYSTIDAECMIQEFNLTILHNQTIIPLSDDELSHFPEFGQYLHAINNDPTAWRAYGDRLVKIFDCNESRAIQFMALSRKYEEFPNQPVFEHHGHYYHIISDLRGGTTASPIPP